jgi:nucleotide-binding universal stress UspA family protein
MCGPVICGVDDSGSAFGAVQVARDVAARYGLPLLFVHVLDPGSDPDEADAAAGLLRDVTASTRTEASWTILGGHPADRLVALAEERDASFAVVGCHGPRSSLLGSISADVSRRAPCAVVVVPPTATPPPALGSDAERVAGGIVRFDLGSAAVGADGR